MSRNLSRLRQRKESVSAKPTPTPTASTTGVAPKSSPLITTLTASQSNLTKTTSISPQLSKPKSNQPSQPPCKQIKTNPKLLSNPQPNKAKSLTRQCSTDRNQIS